MPFKRSLRYGLANLAYFLGYSTFNTYALFFYTDHLHAPAALIGRAWLLFGIWNTANDLLCGWFSDRIPLRFGRRALPVLILGIPVGISFAFLWNPIRPVAEAGPGALFWYFLLLASLYDLFQTAANISQGAAFPEITRASEARPRVAAVRQAYGSIGAALGVAVSPLLYGRFGWGILGIVWGIAISALWLLSAPALRSPRAGETGEAEPAGDWKEGFRVVFGSHASRMLLLIQLATRVALACLQIGMPFYASHVLRLSADQLSAVLGVLLGSAVLTVPAWPWLLRRFDSRAAGIGAALYMAVLLVAFLFAGNWGTLLVLAALLGPAYAGLTVVLDLIFAQVVDAEFVTSGRSRAGWYSGLIGTVLRFSPAVAGVLLAELLALSGYNPALPAQPSSAVLALRVLMTVLPATALALAGLALFAYPLHGERLAELESALRRRGETAPGGESAEAPADEPGPRTAGGPRRRPALIVMATLVLLLVLWLPMFPGRLLLFMLGLARPEGWPNPQVILSVSPRVRRIEFPSKSGRRMVADVYTPGGRPRKAPDRHPGLLLYTPASREGLNNPGVRRAADCFARLGYVVMVPFPEGEQIPHLSAEDLADARASLRQFLRLTEVDPSRSIGAGLSYGSGPLLLAAAEVPPAARPSRFLILGGYADLRELLRFATTGAYAHGSLGGRHEPSPYVRTMLGRTLVAWAEPLDRPLLAKLVEGESRTVSNSLSPGGRRLASLFLNREPERFDALFAALPAPVRSNMEDLSLPSTLSGLEAPVYVVHPQNDRFVPASEARRLWDALPPAARGEVVIPPSLPHGLPSREDPQYLRSLRSLWQVYRLAGGALYRTRTG